MAHGPESSAKPDSPPQALLSSLAPNLRFTLGLNTQHFASSRWSHQHASAESTAARNQNAQIPFYKETVAVYALPTSAGQAAHQPHCSRDGGRNSSPSSPRTTLSFAAGEALGEHREGHLHHITHTERFVQARSRFRQLLRPAVTFI